MSGAVVTGHLVLKITMRDSVWVNLTPHWLKIKLNIKGNKNVAEQFVITSNDLYSIALCNDLLRNDFVTVRCNGIWVFDTLTDTGNNS